MTETSVFSTAVETAKASFSPTKSHKADANTARVSSSPQVQKSSYIQTDTQKTQTKTSERIGNAAPSVHKMFFISTPPYKAYALQNKKIHPEGWIFYWNYLTNTAFAASL